LQNLGPLRLRTEAPKLYHERVALKTNFRAIALLPPGSEARKLTDIKRRLFEEDAACPFEGVPEHPAGPAGLAFPDAAFLAFRAGRTQGCPVRDTELRAVWEGIDGAFRSGRVFERAGGIYLGLEGPLEALCLKIEALQAGSPGGCGRAEGSSWEESIGLPGGGCLYGGGFYLGRAGRPERLELAQKAAAENQLSFLDATLAIVRISLCMAPPALVWKECASGRRRTGPRKLRL